MQIEKRSPGITFFNLKKLFEKQIRMKSDNFYVFHNVIFRNYLTVTFGQEKTTQYLNCVLYLHHNIEIKRCVKKKKTREGNRIGSTADWMADVSFFFFLLF